MIPWSQVATTGDNPCDPNWYKTIIRALNERMNAIGAIPIAEDQTSYPPTSPNSQYPVPGALTIAGVTANQIIAPNDLLSAPFICEPYIKVTVTSVDSIPGLFLSVTGNPIFDPSDTWGAEYGAFTGGGSSMTYTSFTGQADGNLLANGWVPSPGDTVLMKMQPSPTPNIVYPADYKQPAWGYPLWMAMTIELSKYFVNTSIDWDGKSATDIYNSMANLRPWWANYDTQYRPVGYLVFADYCTTYGLFIPPIYLTDYPAWPPQTPPSGWPGGTPFGGFTRKCDRTITSLSDFGVEGELARFIMSRNPQHDDGQGPGADTLTGLGSLAFSFDDITQQPAPTSFAHPATPITDAKYSQMIMLYHSGAWTVNSDQTIQPDQLTYWGLPKWGDTFGPWIINDLKAAINLLTMSIERISPSAGEGLFNTIIPTLNPLISSLSAQIFGVFWDWGAPDFGYIGSSTGVHNGGFGDSPHGYGSSGTEAGAETAYNTYASTVYGAVVDKWDDAAYSYTWIEVDGSGNQYYECASAAIELFMFHWANSKSRTVNFYVNTFNCAIAPGAHTVPFLPSMWTWYDDSGLSLTQSVYTDLHGVTFSGLVHKVNSVTSSLDHVSGGWVGSVAPWLPPWPGIPTGIGDDYSRVNGMTIQPMDATVDWMPSFQYYAGTTLV